MSQLTDKVIGISKEFSEAIRKLTDEADVDYERAQVWQERVRDAWKAAFLCSDDTAFSEWRMKSETASEQREACVAACREKLARVRKLSEESKIFNLKVRLALEKGESDPHEVVDWEKNDDGC